MSNENNYYVIHEIPQDTEYNFNVKLNQSIVMANEVLINNRYPELKNNILNIDGRNIDMYEYAVINNNLKPGEFCLIASSNQYDTWYVRKIYNDLLQYYHFNDEDNFTQRGLFHYFVIGYKQKLSV